MKQRNNLIILSFVLAVTLGISLFAQSYSVPSPISAYDVARWANRGGFIASGTAAPSAVASEGALYVDNTVATQPTLYRYGSGAWHIVAGGGAGGVATHSELAGLSFADSGHTGFASEAALLAHIATYGLHVADQSDPHGATMTISQELTIGDPEATQTAYIDSPSAGLLRLASDVRVVGTLTPASGTVEPYAKYHRVATMTLATASFWTDVEWDTTPLGESSFGFSLLSSSTIQIASGALVQINGCTRPRWTGAAGTAVTMASRIVYSNDGGSTWVEARCLQAVDGREPGENEVGTLPYKGSIKAINGTRVKLQTRVTNTGMVFAGWPGFDSPVAASINLFTSGN